MLAIDWFGSNSRNSVAQRFLENDGGLASRASNAEEGEEGEDSGWDWGQIAGGGGTKKEGMEACCWWSCKK